jgi:hypothetical protein
MKLITSEMDAETDKWQESGAGGTALEENNDIVKRAKNMSSMAFSMYQFTRGEGALKTTQDLFTQAEYFAEEANRLYKVVRQFSYQVWQLFHLRRSPFVCYCLRYVIYDTNYMKQATQAIVIMVVLKRIQEELSVKM